LSTALHLEDTIEVEYVGDPNPLDEITKIRIAMGEIPESAANVLRSAAVRRAKAIKGVNKRIVDPEYFGTSKRYVFGPHDFKVKMTKRDYERVKASRSGHQFRGPGELRNSLILPRDGEEEIVRVSVEEFDNQESVKLVQQSISRRR
jgi:hypothetical protein